MSKDHKHGIVRVTRSLPSEMPQLVDSLPHVALFQSLPIKQVGLKIDSIIEHSRMVEKS